MKKILIATILIFVCVSCKKELYIHTTQILIQNRTESSIRIVVYPKAEYLSGDLYLHSDIGSGSCETEFFLSPNNDEYYNWNEVLFVSGDLNIKPYALAARVFDSIYISTTNEDYMIKFTHETVTGYSENLFSENSTWDYEMVKRNYSENKRTITEFEHCYRFLILEDNFVMYSE